MGINEHHKIISTEGFDSQSLGIRTLIHFFFIDEEHIFGKRTVLDSPSYSKINAYLCALNFLLTGDDSMHLMPEETKEERERRITERTGVIAYLNQKIEELSQRKAELEAREAVGETDAEGRIEELLSAIEEIENEIGTASSENRELMRERYEISTKIEEALFLKDRYRVLKSQYEADILRLQFICDGERKEDTIDEAVACPFCNHEIEKGTVAHSSSLDYPLEIEGEIFYPGSSKELWEERQKGNHRRADWAWRWSKKLFQFGYDNGFVVIKRKKDGSARIYTKTYLNAKIGKDSNGNFVIEYNKRVKATSSLEYIDNKYSNDNAKKDLSLFGLGDKFDYSKPVELIKKLVKAYYKNDALILDFFAGSGTTAQAVLELNEEDGGSRRFIVCTNNENNICQEVTYQRIKTVLTGRMASGCEYKKRVKGNLKYYRTDFVDKNSDELVDELLEHIVEMIQLEYGVSINNSQYLIVMDDDEMDDLETNYNSYKNLKAVFLNQDVLLSTSQERMLQNVDTFIIPDYYFDFELREAGELW